MNLSSVNTRVMPRCGGPQIPKRAAAKADVNHAAAQCPAECGDANAALGAPAWQSEQCDARADNGRNHTRTIARHVFRLRSSRQREPFWIISKKPLKFRPDFAKRAKAANWFERAFSTLEFRCRPEAILHYERIGGRSVSALSENSQRCPQKNTQETADRRAFKVRGLPAHL